MGKLFALACAVFVVGCSTSDGGDDGGGVDQNAPDVTSGTDASKDSSANDAANDSTTNDSATNDASDAGSTNDASDGGTVIIDAGGCDADTTSDPKNCGTCGNICGYGPHSSPGCTKSTCTLICDVGYADCNTQTNDGCEVNTNVDLNNCGKCKFTCLKNQQCVAGQCI